MSSILSVISVCAATKHAMNLSCECRCIRVVNDLLPTIACRDMRVYMCMSGGHVCLNTHVDAGDNVFFSFVGI